MALVVVMVRLVELVASNPWLGHRFLFGRGADFLDRLLDLIDLVAAVLDLLPHHEDAFGMHIKRLLLIFLQLVVLINLTLQNADLRNQCLRDWIALSLVRPHVLRQCV